MVKKILITLSTILFLFTSSYADVYVSLSGNDVTGNGTITLPYLTIQKGVDALKIQGPGNTLYLRGGTYTEIPIGTIGASSGYRVSFTSLNDATSWENSYKIRSYPGEWAVIDGSSYTTDRIYCFYGGDTNGGNGFIEFSHLEIKNAYGATHCAAISTRGGPYKFRYLYIHDNNCGTGSNNPGGLQLTNGSGDVTIEYCYFYHNGYADTVENENSGNIVMYSDYKSDWDGQTLYNASGFSMARHSNIIRYNVIDGGIGADKTSVGIKDKVTQYLANNTYQEGPIVDVNGWSDKGHNIHHNYFVNHLRTSIYLATDFSQIHNNIIVDPDESIYSALQMGSSTMTKRGPYRSIAYNNTVKNGQRGGIDFSYNNSVSGSYYGEYYAYNNIVDTAYTLDSVHPISFKRSYVEYPWDIDNLLHVENNYIYNLIGTYVTRVFTRDYTLSELNSQAWAANNNSAVYNVSDYLYAGTSGADQYKLNQSYSDYTTVSAGGIGGNHPYLTGITLPSYVGAVNPDDNSWVDGLLNDITSTTYLESASGDPTWIEADTPVTTCALEADKTVLSSPTTYTGSASAISGQTITGVTSSGGFTVTPDDGTWDEQTEAFTVSGVIVPVEGVTDTCTAVSSDTNTAQDSIIINLQQDTPTDIYTNFKGGRIKGALFSLLLLLLLLNMNKNRRILE